MEDWNDNHTHRILIRALSRRLNYECYAKKYDYNMDTMQETKGEFG